jgi:hypothetical protein
MYESMSTDLERLEMFEEFPVLSELSSLFRLVVKLRAALVAFYERLLQLAAASG